MPTRGIRVRCGSGWRASPDEPRLAAPPVSRVTCHGVTAALIVRDEEDNLPACVASIRGLGPFLHEVVVLDTGSRDDTVAVARAEGCRVCEVPWRGDFAAARNAAMSLAHTEWVLAVDADERVEVGPGAGRLVRHAADATDAYVLTLTNVDDHGRDVGRIQLARLLRRSRMTWTGAVHEQPQRIDGEIPGLVDVPPQVLTLRHLGYASETRRKTKAARNERVADDAIARLEPAGPSTDLARALLHRGRSRTMIDPLLAEADFRRAWTMAQPGDGVCERAGDGLIRSMSDTGRVKEAVAVIADGRTRGVDEARVAWWTVDVLAAAGKPDAARRLLSSIRPAGSPAAPSREQVARADIRLLCLADRSDEALATAIVHAARGLDVNDDLRRLWGHQPGEMLVRLLSDAGARDPSRVAATVLGNAHAGRTAGS